MANNQSRFLKLSSTPGRIGPIAAMTLISMALEGKCVLSHADLEELESVVISAITALEHDLLGIDVGDETDEPVSAD